MNLIIVAASSHAAIAHRWSSLTAHWPLSSVKPAFIIDGAVSPELSATLPSDSIVQNTSAGCVCCLGGPVLRTALTGLIRQHRPEQCFLIGGSQAQLAGMADATDSPLLTDHLRLQALVWAGDLQIQSQWLDQQREAASLDLTTLAIQPMANGELSSIVWPRHVCFDRQRLQQTLSKLVAPCRCYLDVKTARAWYRVCADQGQWQWRQSYWRLSTRLVFSDSLASTQLATLRNAIEDCQTVSPI
jgi:hypothetical protein